MHRQLILDALDCATRKPVRYTPAVTAPRLPPFWVWLLKDGGIRAQEIIANYQPEFASIEEYFAFVDKLNLDHDAVRYEENKAILNFGA